MIFALLILVALILIAVWFITRNELCERWYCRHKRKDHTFKYWKRSHEWSIGDCKIYDCNCTEFVD